MRQRFSLVFALVLVLTGCSKPADDDADINKGPTRAAITFTGKPDIAYAGKWMSVDGMSQLDLRKDGTTTIVARSYGPGGGSKSNLEGQWAISGSDLYLKYSQNGQEVVLKEKARLAGGQLETVQEANHHKTTYKKG